MIDTTTNVTAVDQEEVKKDQKRKGRSGNRLVSKVAKSAEKELEKYAEYDLRRTLREGQDSNIEETTVSG